VYKYPALERSYVRTTHTWMERFCGLAKLACNTDSQQRVSDFIDSSIAVNMELHEGSECELEYELMSCPARKTPLQQEIGGVPYMDPATRVIDDLIHLRLRTQRMRRFVEIMPQIQVSSCDLSKCSEGGGPTIALDLIPFLARMLSLEAHAEQGTIARSSSHTQSLRRKVRRSRARLYFQRVLNLDPSLYEELKALGRIPGCSKYRELLWKPLGHA
jgi:hypothetical protein